MTVFMIIIFTVVSILLCIIGLKSSNLDIGKNRIEIVQKSLTGAAIITAGIWAFYQFQITQVQIKEEQKIKKEERKEEGVGIPAIETAIKSDHSLINDDRVFLRVTLMLKNIGQGLYEPKYGWGAFARIHSIRSTAEKPQKNDSKKDCPPNGDFNFLSWAKDEDTSCFQVLGESAGGYDSKEKVRSIERGESTTINLHFMLPIGTKTVSIYAKPFECAEYNCVEKVIMRSEEKKFEGVWSLYRIDEEKAINL